MFRPQAVSVKCQRCGMNLRVPVFSIIDVGQTPELKQALLANQLNAGQCPNCGAVNFLAAPLLYHDPEHQFLGVFVPNQLNLSENKRQQAIGDLTKALMDALPAEQRRGYMLTPQQFLTMDSLVEKILGFDGITPEMIAASRKKAQLVEDLVRQREDTFAFNITVKENEKLLDQEFFMLLGNFILAARSQGQEAQAEMLESVRDKLLPITEYGRRIDKQRQAVRRLGERPTRAQIFEAFLAADLDETEALTVVARPALDYQFFQDFTAAIEAASGEERKALEAKRERMLAMLEELRAVDQQAAQQASQVIHALLGADDLHQAVREMAPYIDQDVIDLLNMNIAEAQQKGAKAAARRLQQLVQIIDEVLAEGMPPGVRLLYELLDASYPDGTRDVLRNHKSEINAEFLGLLESSIKRLEEQANGDDQSARLAHHLKNVLTQARLGV